MGANMVAHIAGGKKRRLYENRVFRRMFGTKRDGETKGVEKTT